MLHRNLLLIIFVFTLTSCVKNLNEEVYFRKVKNKSPETHKILVKHKEKIEEQIRKALLPEMETTATRLTFWGEGVDYVNRPFDGEVLSMRGLVYYRNDTGAKYFISFTVDNFGNIEVINKNIQKVWRNR